MLSLVTTLMTSKLVTLNGNMGATTTNHTTPEAFTATMTTTAFAAAITTTYPLLFP